MPTYPWQPIVTRWADAVYGIALLLADDRGLAERATVDAFATVLASPPADVETALYAELLKRRHGARPLRAYRELPRQISRIAPRDRVLLALWLLRGVDGRRLAAMSHLDPDALVERLVGALRHLIGDAIPAAREARGADSWRRYVAADLGFKPVAPAAPEYTRALDAVRGALRGAIGRASLPRHAYESIDVAIILRREALQTPWWQRPAGAIGLLLVGTALFMLLLIAPWQNAPQAARTAAATLDARDVVTQVLARWDTPPITGTLHRRVWARDTTRTGRGAEPVLTDVWLEADSPRHRIETRRGAALVEWQIADGEDSLWYAAEPGEGACRWTDLPILPARSARNLEATPNQQAEALRTRLTLGAYGEGYHALRRALDAPDLRSFGMRAESGATLLVLGYTDRDHNPPQQVLLWIDVAEDELHAVQTIQQAGGQTAARDIWRLKERALLPGSMPRARPPWSRTSPERAQVIDPGCLTLRERYIVSPRVLASSSWFWSTLYLPATPPPGTTDALLISPNARNQEVFGIVPDTRALFVGPGRSLSLTLTGRNAFVTGNVAGDDWPLVRTAQGTWAVNLVREREWLRGTLCRRIEGQQCAPAIPIAARGWTEAEIMALVESLTVADARVWLAMDEIFFDPAPLDASTMAVLRAAIDASIPTDGSIYVRAIRANRVAPDPPAFDDPYHVPATLLAPPQVIVEQWIERRDGQVVGFNEQSTLPDGVLVRVDRSDGVSYIRYDATSGVARSMPAERMQFWMPPVQALPATMITELLGSTTPISLSATSDALVLEREIADSELRFYPQFWVADTTDLRGGRYVRRVFIDPATHRPRRAELLHRSGAGGETLIAATEIQAWRVDDSSLDRSLLELPALPDESFVFEDRFDGRPRLIAPRAALDLPARFLVWDETTSLSISRARDPTGTANPDARIAQAIYGDLYNLDSTGLIKVTHYRIAPIDVAITVRQGNRLLLRHLLRYNQPGISVPDRSRTAAPIATTIGGEPATAWLINNGGNPALIVEVADLLLHISGPDSETLRHYVADALPAMVWTP